MCVDSVDQINGVIPFRLTPVKLASLVFRGNIQGATSEWSNRVRVCDRECGKPQSGVRFLHLHRSLSIGLGWEGGVAKASAMA